MTQLLVGGLHGLESAVRVLLGVASRPALVSLWPLINPYAGQVLVQEALQAATHRWAAPLGCKQPVASRYQREYIHSLLLVPGLCEAWCWALPQLADNQLSWAQGCDLADQLVRARKRYPPLSPSNLQVGDLASQR